MERKYNKYFELKKTRDRGDLRRNLINSVFEGLKTEDCLADRGDAEPGNSRIASPKFRPNDNVISSQFQKKSPENACQNLKLNNNGEEREKRDKDRKNLNVNLKLEDRICPVKLIEVNHSHLLETERREEKRYEKKTENRDKSDGQIKTYLDFEGRRKLRERYTVKLKNKNGEAENKDELNNKKGVTKDKEEIKVKSDNSKDNLKKETLQQKTNKIKHDNRLYKGIFVDKKLNAIEIKIPEEKKIVKLENIKEVKETKVIHKKNKKKFKSKPRIQSPEMRIRHASPTSEVAQWSPSCLNQHAQYYEAWVDTTLPINKYTNNDEIYNNNEQLYYANDKFCVKNENLYTFERVVSPIYEKCNDVRYTGKIVVRK